MKYTLLSMLVASSLLLATGVQAVPVTTPAHMSAPTQSDTVRTVDINTASAQEISSILVGVGEKRAEQIIQLREQLGGFTEMEQLLDVKGIGAKTLEKNRRRIAIQ